MPSREIPCMSWNWHSGSVGRSSMGASRSSSDAYYGSPCSILYWCRVRSKIWRSASVRPIANISKWYPVGLERFEVHSTGEVALEDGIPTCRLHTGSPWLSPSSGHSRAQPSTWCRWQTPAGTLPPPGHRYLQ